MKALSETLVECAAFLELSDDNIVDPDAAVRALESIASGLSDASAEETKALLRYCAQQAAALGVPKTPLEEKRRAFYLGFGEAFGLTDE